MKEIGLGLAGLGLLYLTRRKMTQELGRLVRKLGGGDRAFLIVWSAIFLPGTIIHEVSHFLAAAMTGAKTGRVEIFPELPSKKLRDPSAPSNGALGMTAKLGFVETQRLGPVRGFLVGTAPLLVGLGILIWIAGPKDQILHTWTQDLILWYLFFTVANSLFLSWADVKQALPLLVIAAILGGGVYFAGIRPEIVPDSRLILLLTSLWKAVWISAGVNLGVVTIVWVTNGILGRLRGFRGI